MLLDVVIVANYTSKSCFTNRLSHFEGKEVFSFANQPVDCPLSGKNDSHCLDHVNFSHPRITILDVMPNNVEDVRM
jgi:hypothetical protein